MTEKKAKNDESLKVIGIEGGVRESENSKTAHHKNLRTL